MSATRSPPGRTGGPGAPELLPVPFADTAVGLARLRANAVELLRRAEVDSRPDELKEIAARWEATLVDDVGLASS